MNNFLIVIEFYGDPNTEFIFIHGLKKNRNMYVICGRQEGEYHKTQLNIKSKCA